MLTFHEWFTNAARYLHQTEVVMIEILVGLQNEHRNLVRIADLLSTRAAAVSPPNTADLTLLTDTVYYLTHFPDVFHHPREDALAGWLEGRGVLSKELLDTLASQHLELLVQGRDLLRDLESLLRVETETWAGLAPRLHAYADALRLNMATEEERLLPVAFGEASEAPHAIIAELALRCEADPLLQQTDERFAQLRAVIIAEAGCTCDQKPIVAYGSDTEGNLR